ncbi:TlpA family protein disulfide reductase [Prosthecobacter vanneervenii]|uniref:Thiol-disulfide isomerase/thioredoxin n=1 Tax=Prosthecobacter vanneervenii TaxID=48466 RepID=A0A7W7Y8G2_9BACT|nr:TlpA disulfide reductase family protein [Prosthecobacter vanneervenii]MBB5031390.1 thiol-disulfide isomerase/thioredoxin [Prosthecobacter vanneervenii]
MKFAICVLLLCSSGLAGAQSAPSAEAEAEAAVTAAKAKAQRLFAAGISEKELLEVAKEANKSGVPRQQIIEAKLVWGLRSQNTDFLVKILPEVEILAENFDPATAAAMPNADAVRSFISYIKAMKAESSQDEAGFKQHILEALWLNPQQGQVFLQSISKHRLADEMANLKVDLKLPLTTSGGEATTLNDVLGGKKALLLDFWASWCGPCMQLMPALKHKAETLSAHGIVVAAVNKDDENAESTAERLRNELSMPMPWLVEPPERPFTKELQIESIPRMVLISPDGKVLFNGHPEDPALWVALKKIDPAIEPVKAQ